MERTDGMSWRTSSYSGNGGECVEAGRSADGMVLIRDTKQHGTGPAHRYTPDQWRAFIAGMKAGKFGLDGSGRVS